MDPTGTVTPPRRDLRTPTTVSGLVAVGTLILAVRDPHGGGYGICPVLAVTGYLCPTCGGLRAVHDLATGNIAGAWQMNQFLTIALPVVAVTIGIWWWRAYRNLPARQVPVPLILAVAALTMGFGVVRNLWLV